MVFAYPGSLSAMAVPIAMMPPTKSAPLMLALTKPAPKKPSNADIVVAVSQEPLYVMAANSVLMVKMKSVAQV